MRAFSVRRFPNMVLIEPCGYPRSIQGGANPAPAPGGTPIACTFQPSRDRGGRQSGPTGAARETSMQSARVGFAADPLVKYGDLIVWVDGGGARYTAQGTANRDGGCSTIFWVDVSLNQ